MVYYTDESDPESVQAQTEALFDVCFLRALALRAYLVSQQPAGTEDDEIEGYKIDQKIMLEINATYKESLDLLKRHLVIKSKIMWPEAPRPQYSVDDDESDYGPANPILPWMDYRSAAGGVFSEEWGRKFGFESPWSFPVTEERTPNSDLVILQTFLGTNSYKLVFSEVPIDYAQTFDFWFPPNTPFPRGEISGESTDKDEEVKRAWDGMPTLRLNVRPAENPADSSSGEPQRKNVRRSEARPLHVFL